MSWLLFLMRTAFRTQDGFLQWWRHLPILWWEGARVHFNVLIESDLHDPILTYIFYHAEEGSVKPCLEPPYALKWPFC